MTARILVVDDIAANRRLLEAKLQSEFYEVALAQSGEEALRQASGWSPDIILLDVMMPGMDGFETCRRLKADPALMHIPVVMVTALTEAAERVRGLEAGADDFLSKPVDDATLFARLRALMRVKQVQDAWRLRAETARDLGFEAPGAPDSGVVGAHALVLGEENDVISTALRQDGVLVECFDAVDAIWQRLNQGGVDLAILCLPAEGGDTLRLASRLRANGVTRDVPVILVARPEQRALVLRGFDIGTNDHVLMPVDPNELRARVRNQIRRKRYQDRLRAELDRSLEMAVTDPLTGLRNRRYVRRHLDGLLRGGEVAVLMLDLDRFKPINDTWGHNVGDAALREIANRLRVNLRASDVVARWGGEEFLVVMAGAPPEYAMLVAERLREAVADEPLQLGPVEINATVSIGAAVAPAGTDSDVVIGAADAALYRAKAGGRNAVRMADAGDLGRQAAN
ncbi:PleD family two-component system response regulator [Rhodovarius crocodyli]|uniref:diguanylate cyclase n=1 Tax=Rhodovarius crocodyli TaxID=1979269 RepID=A0A437MJN4_9PROT|nr:PleD family two-component system response regulator [Rhodovarius crocodyli]RVT97860.1 PleD family two-component system response regulator [Rhodovarius crocodyli]